MHDAFLIVAVILFALSGLAPVSPSAPGWASSVLVSAGLAFFAASFVVTG